MTEGKPQRYEPLTAVFPPLRVEPSIAQEVEELAAVEAGGKVSKMARQLIHEALAARRRARAQGQAETAPEADSA